MTTLAHSWPDHVNIRAALAERDPTVRATSLRATTLTASGSTDTPGPHALCRLTARPAGTQHTEDPVITLRAPAVEALAQRWAARDGNPAAVEKATRDVYPRTRFAT